MQDKQVVTDAEKEKIYIKSKTIWGGKCDKGYIKYETPSGETVSLKLGRD